MSSYNTMPLGPTPEQTAFIAVQAEYNDLIWDIATQEPWGGYWDVSQLPSLSDEDRSLVIRAKPAVLTGINLDTTVLVQLYGAIKNQVLDDVLSYCGNRAERAAEQQYEDFHGGGHCMTMDELIRQNFEQARRLK